MKNKFLRYTLLFFIATAGVWAEGNETIDLLKSPDILASGGSLTSTVSPMADVLNPAASAGQQRITLSTGYTGLAFDDDVPGYTGTAFNLGISYPTRSGVITGSGFVIGTSATAPAEVNAGLQGGLNASFSKELYPDLYTGAGLNLSFGESWAATVDFGIIQNLGTIGIMQNFKWAAVLSNFGYSGFSTTDSPSVFTPGAGACFDIVNNDDLKWSVSSDILFPTFSNIRLNVATGINLFDFAGIMISSTADLSEILESDVSALIPAFGVNFNFKADFRDEEDKNAEQSIWTKSDITASMSAAPMKNGLWAGSAGAVMNIGVIDEEAPVIELDMSGFSGVKSEDVNPNDDESSTDVESGDDTSDIGPDDGSDVSFGYGKFSGKSFSRKVKKTVSNDNDKNLLNKSVNKGNIDRGPQGEQVIMYMSPNNDGVQDYMEIPVSIRDTRYIKGFAFIVEDSEGNEIKRIENKEKRPENLGLANFFERLFYVEKGVDIPDTVRWDGIDEEGNVVADGFYNFHMEAWDDNGNRSETNRYGLVIDNTPPLLEIENPSDNEKIFSPNDDGNKDVLDINIDGSVEDSWKAVIKSADGKEHKHYEWKGNSPENFSWDGKNDRKNLVQDGVYFFYVEATDRAGNRTEGEIPNIIINTQSTPIALSVNTAFFAPGVTGSIDNVVFSAEVPVQTGISEWSFRIKNSTGKTVKEEKGTSEVPGEFTYYGNYEGGFIEEGEYKGFLDIRYINGNNPSTVSPVIISDKTAPSASAKVSSRVFSPNGDGNKDSVTIYQETSTEDVWYGQITDEAKNVVREYKWINNAETSFEWQGYTEDGELASDGEYRYKVYTVDKAGNKGASEAVPFGLDTEETPVILTANMDAFSPNGDGIKEKITIAPVLNVNQGIQSFSLEITDEKGAPVKSISGQGRVPGKFEWDGFTDDGKMAEDGSYKASIKVVYEKGDVSTAGTRSFILDTVFPVIEIDSEYTLFSPEGDGRRDELLIRQNTSSEDLITARIKNSENQIIREFLWQNETDDLMWDGTDSNGNKVPDGKYEYVIFSEDKAGNKTEEIIKDITIDTRNVNVFITASEKGFTPNGDGNNDRIEFSTIATMQEGVKEWKLKIMKDGTDAIKTFSGEVLPEKVIWNGEDSNGRIVEGNYTAIYSVEYFKGNMPVTETKPFIIDITSPEIGVNITPEPFSPDNDGVEDELEIKISVEDRSEIDSWSLEIVDREGNKFKSYGGKGKPAEKIIWDGIGGSGELVIAAEDYPYKLSVKDIYGNESVKYGIIPVDVLVVKEGDKLKIRIANITFAPDSAELRTDDPEIKEKNIYVLGRLSEILQKYESYKIKIEGHAVSVYHADLERAEKEEIEELKPLSKARAETVKYYLEELGISSQRMSTEGIGGKQPIVPHSDLENRWKNRRVEFILIK